jgi:hypothetical protein
VKWEREWEMEGESFQSLYGFIPPAAAARAGVGLTDSFEETVP